MASLSLYPQFETNLMSNRNVIELHLQLKSTRAHAKNYVRVNAHLVRHLLRNRLFTALNARENGGGNEWKMVKITLLIRLCQNYSKKLPKRSLSSFKILDV